MNMKSDTLAPNKDFEYSRHFYVMTVYFVFMMAWSLLLARAVF